MKTWFVLHTKPRQEAVAQAQLERQGYPVYYPRLCLPRLRRSRWSDVIEPLFPRYLFVGLEVGEQAMAPVRSTRGVSAVLRFGDRYAEVPAALIEALRDRADESGLHVLADSGFRKGDRLHIIAGPFEGFDAVFECERGADRARVLLEFLGASTAVTLPKGFIVPTLRQGSELPKCP
jgi:transcriptional antiterminator RfaH